MEEKPEFVQTESRPAVLEPLHHSNTFVESLLSPDIDNLDDPFGDLESHARQSLDDPQIPRHLRLGSEWRNLKRSKGRLALTVAGLVAAWLLCITVITYLRTHDLRGMRF